MCSYKYRGTLLFCFVAIFLLLFILSPNPNHKTETRAKPIAKKQNQKWDHVLVVDWNKQNILFNSNGVQDSRFGISSGLKPLTIGLIIGLRLRNKLNLFCY